MQVSLSATNVGTRCRFGVFEFDQTTLELVKGGRAVSLRPQPLKLLALLLARPGELVSRDSLQRALWDGDTFVDFEQGVNHAIRELRAALGDVAESPRFIQTLPKRGYRFIAPVELVVPPDTRAPAPDVQEPPSRDEPIRRADRSRLWIAAAIGVVAVIAIVTVSLTWRAEPASNPYALGTLAVRPFSSRDDPALGVGLAKAIATRLAGQQSVPVHCCSRWRTARQRPRRRGRALRSPAFWHRSVIPPRRASRSSAC